MTGSPREPLELDVDIDASAEKVFDTLVDPESFAVWMGAATGRATIDPRVGGEVRVEFPSDLVVLGKVLELEPPRRVLLSWGVKSGDPFPPGATRVEFLVEPRGAGARLVLRHHDLPEEERDPHRGGWRLYLSVLAATAARAQHEAKVAATVEGWFAAWRESDPKRRGEILARCTAEGVEFRHAFAATGDRVELSRHIRSSREHMKGMLLEPDGEPRLCHGWVSFPWKVTKEGTPVAAGTNVGHLDADSRFELVIGF